MFAFPGVLVLHAVGMGLLVGANLAVDLRILGSARRIPLPSLGGLYPIMWFGFWLNAVSGILLLIAYPTKALTNFVFYAKLLLILLAMVDMRWLQVRIVRNSQLLSPADLSTAKIMAGLSIVLWLAAITSGRLLAYTATRLLVDVPNF